MSLSSHARKHIDLLINNHQFEYVAFDNNRLMRSEFMNHRVVFTFVNDSVVEMRHKHSAQDAVNKHLLYITDHTSPDVFMDRVLAVLTESNDKATPKEKIADPALVYQYVVNGIPMFGVCLESALDYRKQFINSVQVIKTVDTIPDACYYIRTNYMHHLGLKCTARPSSSGFYNAYNVEELVAGIAHSFRGKTAFGLSPFNEINIGDYPRADQYPCSFIVDVDWEEETCRLIHTAKSILVSVD